MFPELQAGQGFDRRAWLLQSNLMKPYNYILELVTHCVCSHHA